MEPKDLEGRTIGRSASGASVNMFPAFLKANNIDRSKIREVVVDGATFVLLLMSGQADAVLEQSIVAGTPYDRCSAGQDRGSDALFRVWARRDTGMQSLRDVSTIQQKTRRGPTSSVEASLKGVAYSFAHPDEAVAILRKTNPEIDANVAKDELLELKNMESTDQIRELGLGYVDNGKMEKNRDNIAGPLALKRTVPVAEIYTNEFLPKNPIVPSGK